MTERFDAPRPSFSQTEFVSAHVRGGKPLYFSSAADRDRFDAGVNAHIEQIKRDAAPKVAPKAEPKVDAQAAVARAHKREREASSKPLGAQYFGATETKRSSKLDDAAEAKLDGRQKMIERDTTLKPLGQQFFPKDK